MDIYDDWNDLPSWRVVDASFEYKSGAEECGLMINQGGRSCNISLVISAVTLFHILDR